MHLRIALLLSVSLCAPIALAQPAVDFVRVVKSERKLMLFSGGEVVREFRIALGGNPAGRKQEEGDQRTPEGSYILDYKKSDSIYYKAIHISYPNPDDIAAAEQRGVRPGGQIMIHGQKKDGGRFASLAEFVDWTQGCIALKNEEMDELWDRIAEGTKIEILP